MSKSRPLLTISLLISNRMETIPRCLDSLHLIMDEIPCELILTDTSKNPEVHNLLLKYTDQVYEFEWCNDFAKARNLGLQKACGEWFMFLDDDEWFVEVDELIAFFKYGEYKKYNCANYIVRNFVDEKQVQYEDIWVSRLVKIQDTTRFVGKVHEYFLIADRKCKELNVVAHHSGYIYETKGKREAHFERNYKLLIEMISEEPNNFRWHLHLVQEYMTVGKWDEVIQFCEECLKTIGDETSDAICVHIGTFYEGIVRALQAKKDYANSIDVCKKALNDIRIKEIASAKMYYRLAENYFTLEEFEDALVYAEKYLQISSLDINNDVNLLTQTRTVLIGDVFEERYIRSIYTILICCYLELGKIDPLLEYYDKLCWNEKVIYSIDHVEKYMVKAMWTNEYHLIFLRIMVDVLGNKKLSEYFRKEILSQDLKFKNEFQRTLYAFSEAVQDLIDGPYDGDMIEYDMALGRYVNALCDWNDFIELQGGMEIENENTLGYFQAAINISEYLNKESQNTLEALRSLKNAVENLPEIADGVSMFLDSYRVLNKQRAERQQKEMEMLRVQVIAQAKMMIEQGQIQAASQIVTQIGKMFPEDAEINELAQMLQKNNGET